MGAWGFVWLAYGIVWLVLLAYVFILRHRLRRVEAELAELRLSENNNNTLTRG